MRRNTARLSCHTSSLSVDSDPIRMHHPMRVITRTDEIATKIRVEKFEMLKQKTNNATKKITILYTEDRFQKRESRTTFEEATDDVRPHKQRPGKAENNNHPFKTEGSIRTLIEICRLPKC